MLNDTMPRHVECSILIGQKVPVVRVMLMDIFEYIIVSIVTTYTGTYTAAYRADAQRENV